MCVQCMMTAMTSVAAASGTRSWLAQRRADWLTPRRLRYITLALFTVAILVAGTMSGSS
jgi:polyferredoxin